MYRKLRLLTLFYYLFWLQCMEVGWGSGWGGCAESVPSLADWRNPLAKAAEILQESWSILSRDSRWNGFFGGCFQHLAALIVFCNLKPLFKRNEDISSRLRDKILTNFWSHFSSLGQGFLRPPFWTRRRPWGRGWVVYLIFLFYIKFIRFKQMHEVLRKMYL